MMEVQESLVKDLVALVAPELEVWVWTSSPDVPRCLGWEGREPSFLRLTGALRTWFPP